MSFGSYLEENILKPANLSNTFYWTGMPGGQPGGLRKGVVPLPGYNTIFERDSGTFSASRSSNANYGKVQGVKYKLTRKLGYVS